MDDKICSDCEIEKSVSSFNVQTSVKDGLQSKCRECERIYRQSKAGKEVRRKYVQANMDKVTARNILASAMRYGKMERQSCHCGETKVEAHHEDYSKPLDVEWLCKKHHK